MDRDELFREAVKENDKMIKRICYYFFGTDEDANDAHQEILLKIWLNIEKFRNKSKVKTWIYRIAVNVCITLISKAKRKTSLFISTTNQEDKIRYDDETDKIDNEIKLMFFRNFIDKLNTTEKMLVSLYVEELNTKEISNITGLSESNVRVKLHRIKNQIRKEWSAKYGT